MDHVLVRGKIGQIVPKKQKDRQNETTTEPEEVGQIQEGERASSEINTEPARRSLRENRGRPPARFGEWTNK